MIIVDIEASGTDYQKHSIVSVGALDFNSPDNRFYKECRIWEGARIMDDSLEVNGFSEAEITDQNKPTEGEVIQEFLEWSQHFYDRTLAGQNVAFDRDFLKAAAHRAKLSWDIPTRTIDSHTLCFMHMVQRGHEVPMDEQHRHMNLSLSTILQYCGIPEEPRPHNALTGALAHTEVISRLIYNKKLLPEFEEYEMQWS